MSGIRLICPFCKATLCDVPGGLACVDCGRSVPVEDGVVRLLEDIDQFYEGAYENQVRFLPRSEKPWHVWPLWLINSGYAWSVRRHVPEGAVVVELGCAGGVNYFGQRYHMIGCDVSLSSLKKVATYERRVQADAAVCIPLPDASVDAVVSSYFWEHIPPDVKPAILRECHRILRPRGKIIFLYDVETENPLIRHYRSRDERLYRKLFVEGDGHLGYQSPRENIGIFEACGFRAVEQAGMEKTWLQSPSAYVKLAQFSGHLRRLIARLGNLGKQRWFYPYTALMRVIDVAVCPWLPEDWARIELVVAEKSSA